MNGSAAFSTDDDYYLFKLKWTKTLAWVEKQYGAFTGGTITGGKIATGTITAGKIAVGSISTSRITATTLANWRNGPATVPANVGALNKSGR